MTTSFRIPKDYPSKVKYTNKIENKKVHFIITKDLIQDAWRF